MNLTLILLWFCLVYVKLTPNFVSFFFFCNFKNQQRVEVEKLRKWKNIKQFWTNLSLVQLSSRIIDAWAIKVNPLKKETSSTKHKAWQWRLLPKEVISRAETSEHEAWTIKANPTTKETFVAKATNALLNTPLDNL